ncbi:hypothetical protein HY989_01585 [Candidatus Micrarchaeota archaeon]|nr:hypothetical protein [Candidatus Micrarchaeota archaeon]
MFNGQPCGHFVTYCDLGQQNIFNVKINIKTNLQTSSTCINSTGGLWIKANVLPFTISSLSTSNTSNSITVNWHTDVASTSNLTFGTSSGSYSNTLPSNPTPVTDHTMVISNLAPSSTFYFKAESCIQDGCTSVTSSDTTKPEDTSSVPSVTPSDQVIHHIKVNSISPSKSLVSQGSMVSFVISLTNLGNVQDAFQVDAADSFLGSSNKIFTGSKTLAAGETSSVSFDWNTKTAVVGRHSITATILLPSDLSPNDNSQSTVVEITDASQTPKIKAESIKVRQTTQTATIEWDTDLSSDAEVRYGETTKALDKVAKSSSLVTHHSVELLGLTKGTTYDFVITSCLRTACANEPASGRLKFTTKTDESVSCSFKNYCKTEPAPAYVTHKEVDGVCVENIPTKCVVKGCLTPACNELEGGCYGAVDDSKCQDVCDKKSLKLTGSCTVDAKDKTNGVCEYNEPVCNEQTACLTSTIACGGSDYYCVKIGENYLWSQDYSSCRDLGSEIQRKVSVADPSGTITTVESGFEKNSEDVDEFLQRATGGERNTIKATGIITEPDIIKIDQKAGIFITTNSKTNIESKNILCVAPTDSKSICYCETGYLGNNKNIKCEVLPPVSGTYNITLLNDEKQGGKMEVELIPGKKAAIFNIKVKDRQNNDVIFISLGISVLMIIVTFGIILNKRIQLKGFGKKMQREKELIAGQKDALKYKFMKREISQDEFTKAFMVLDKREAEADARLNEWADKQEGKNKNSQKETGQKEEPQKTQKDEEKPLKEEKSATDGLDSKNQSVISNFKASQTINKPKPEENKELDNLFDELKKKTGGEKKN